MASGKRLDQVREAAVARPPSEQPSLQVAEAVEPEAAEAPLRCDATSPAGVKCGTIATNRMDYERHRFRVHGIGSQEGLTRFERHMAEELGIEISRP